MENGYREKIESLICMSRKIAFDKEVLKVWIETIYDGGRLDLNRYEVIIRQEEFINTPVR